ncbi:response regulator [Sunxiuqinia sp. sy24]|uniref:response regulator n=1 Tax=Sunxiuqinia sp. sy24 TaxID=3461495 RepID=UPI004045BEB4
MNEEIRPPLQERNKYVDYLDMAARKILIIDDNRSFSKTLRNVLKSNGYESVTAGSGGEGIQKAYEYGPDLILCDIKMAPIDGYQVCNILKESSITKKIPFIFITGKSGLDEIRLGLELGADDYLVKPFRNEALLTSIKTRLEKYEYLVNLGRSKYQAFVDYSPNGIFLFDGTSIYESNPAFNQMVGILESAITGTQFSDLIGKTNFAKLEDRINQCMNGLLSNFQEEISILTSIGVQEKFVLYVAPSVKYNGFSLLTGLLMPVGKTDQSKQEEFEQLVSILEEEEIDLTDPVIQRLQKEFDSRYARVMDREYSPVSVASEVEFSRRELEVLKLSCKGLPIKTIAEELCISGRTVESHRASLMEKTASKNIIEVIIYAFKNQLVEI